MGRSGPWGFKLPMRAAGRTEQRPTCPRPEQIGTGLPIGRSISASDHQFLLPLKQNGTLCDLGNNSNGQLGDSTTKQQNAPEQIGAATGGKQSPADREFCDCLETNGTFWAWGINSNGQLGDGTVSTIPRSKLARPLIGESYIRRIICFGGVEKRRHPVGMGTHQQSARSHPDRVPQRLGRASQQGLKAPMAYRPTERFGAWVTIVLGNSATVPRARPVPRSSPKWVPGRTGPCCLLVWTWQNTYWPVQTERSGLWGWNREGQLGYGLASTGILRTPLPYHGCHPAVVTLSAMPLRE